MYDGSLTFAERGVTAVKRRRARYEEADEAMELGDVLESYEEHSGWTQEGYAPAEVEYEDPYMQGFSDGYYGEEYSEEHEAVDHESRFRIAMGAFDLVSIFVGIIVILLLVAMLITLFNWLRSDISHSMLLMQSGLQ